VNLLRERPAVGAFVSSRGVTVIECRRAPAGMEIARSHDVVHGLATAEEAADQLVEALRSAGIANASVSLALRGFGLVHHSLRLPSAPDDVLTPIIERELRRLDPQLRDPVATWVALPEVEESAGDAPPQRSFLAAAVPVATIRAFEQRLKSAGHRLAHLTALPVSMQRLLDQFDSGTGTSATVTPLPDGAFIGFSLNGGFHLVVEPPLAPNAHYETAALAEEADLGAMFVRQQFRGLNLDRVVLFGALESLFDLKAALAERLNIPVKQVEFPGVTPAALAALGAVLDAQSPEPFSLGGRTRYRTPARPASRLELVSMAAVLVLGLVGAWTIYETVRATRAESALVTAQRQVAQDSFGLQPVRTTADQRRVVNDAHEALRLVDQDRLALQRVLSGIAIATNGPVRLDSLRLTRRQAAWMAVVGGRVTGLTNARAVQALHDLYREIPQRLRVDSLRLDELSYADDGDPQTGESVVRFRIAFEVPSAALERQN
jgi:hypothetical protein